MKNFTVSVTAMQSHIKVNENWGATFHTYDAAKAEFVDLCDRLNIPDPEDLSQDGGDLTAGGIGYDYRIELTFSND